MMDLEFRNRLAALRECAEEVENEACKLLNDLAAELIPTTPELTAEATYQLKTHSMSTLSRTIAAIMEVATK